MAHPVLEHQGLQHCTKFVPEVIRPLAIKKLRWHLVAAGDKLVVFQLFFLLGWFNLTETA
ncbi:hypothetical protein [Rheinheimera sp. A13L]|uniref:hypothetical protein n=1 Tax=Rheinheimera sp. A13L TaxID=506534 RepID=UPI0002FB698D|nr:hypothetical protein [Rheinheimera sp. A13L]